MATGEWVDLADCPACLKSLKALNGLGSRCGSKSCKVN